MDISPDDVQQMKVSELKDALKTAGLSTNGLKAVLQERLTAFVSDTQNAEESEEAPAAIEVEVPETQEDMDQEAVDMETQEAEVEAEAEESEATTTVEVTMAEETEDATMAETEETAEPEASEEEESENPKTGFLDISNAFPVWIGDLPMETTEEQLTEFFNEFGQVSSVRLRAARGRVTNRKFAFVNFTTQEAQLKAVEKDGGEFQGTTIQVKARETNEKWRKIFLGNLNVDTLEELEEYLEKEGNWDIKKIQFKENQKFSFCFFNCQDEANKFYDDMQGREINGQVVNVEFPRTKEEREAIKAGVPKKDIEKAKRTVYLSGLAENVSEEDIQAFVDADFADKPCQVQKPKSKNKRTRNIAFLAFERKAHADQFVSQFGPKTVGEINGSEFGAEISKINIKGRRENFGGRRGYQGGRGGYGGGYGAAPYGNPYAWAQYYANMGMGGYGGGRGGYGHYGGYGNKGGYGQSYGRGGGRGRGGRGYQPY